MKHIVFFLTAALLLNASCGSSDEGGKTDPPAAPVPVALSLIHISEPTRPY